jgi:Glycosyl transferase family 2
MSPSVNHLLSSRAALVPAMRATGEVLMILDADLTVPPEDLPRFYEAIQSGKGEFINGVRVVYPMEKQAMRFVNLLGNKFFSLAFSWLLGQSIDQRYLVRN